MVVGRAWTSSAANARMSLTGAVTPETEQQVRALCVIEIGKKEFLLDSLEDALKRSRALPAPAVSTCL